MNRENLNAVLEAYVERFDKLNDINGNDEGYKWRATTWFKKHWDIDAEDFVTMFKLAMKNTANLIDNARVQPIGGILELLKHKEEVEFVRKCFRELFSEDDGDLIVRQKRVDSFCKKINERIERYIVGSYRYTQKYNHAIYYLNLWRPEDNYIFKSTEANEWANCVEYGDDFGSGATFSLEKYYRMCDELLAELPSHCELMRLHNERIKKEMQGYDDKLHILVYDIIYCACAKAYNLYRGISVSKSSAKERIKNIHTRQMRETLQIEITEKENNLRDMEDISIDLPDITGECLQHKKFGNGVIISCMRNVLSVDFLGENKNFQYPDAFLQGYLILENNLSYDKIVQIDRVKKKKKTLLDEIVLLKRKLEEIK